MTRLPLDLAAALTALSLAAAAADAADLRVPDHYDTVQQAVNAAAPGDRVLIDEDSYDEKVLVQFKHDIQIRGVGGKARLDSLEVRDSSAIHLKALEFDHTMVAAQVIVRSSETVLVQKCSFEGDDGSMGTGLSVVDSTEVMAHQCSFAKLANGVLVSGSTNVGVVASKVLKCGSEGIRFEDSDEAVVMDSLITKSTVRLVGLFAADALIAGNTLKKSDAYVEGIGVYAVENAFKKSSANLRGEGSVFFANQMKRGGLRLDYGIGNYVAENAIAKAPMNGIHVDYSATANWIEDNAVFASAQYDLYADAPALNSYSGNSFFTSNF